MLDAFIIDRLKREKDHTEEKTVPLTLELPIPDEEFQKRKKEEERKKKPQNISAQL